MRSSRLLRSRAARLKKYVAQAPTPQTLITTRAAATPSSKASRLSRPVCTVAPCVIELKIARVTSPTSNGVSQNAVHNSMFRAYSPGW